MSGYSPNTDNLDSNYFKESLPIACSWKQPDLTAKPRLFAGK